MNYEVIDSPRRIAQQDASDQHAAQAELAMHDDFVSACKAGDVYARCGWAPLGVIRDSDGKYVHSKVQTLDDVMQGALDYGNEPRAATVAIIGRSAIGADGITVAVGALGTATAGYSGTATAGHSGTICIKYWDSKADRYRTVIGYTGEDGIEANVAYRLNDKHKFVKAV